MKGTEVLCLSRRWNLEKWKCCICILICPQSGIVFGVAAKLPGVCSSSLFIGTTWDTGLKFKSACYHSVWRWGFLSLFSLCRLRSLPLSLTPSVTVLLNHSAVFHHSTSIFNYFPLLLLHLGCFPLLSLFAPLSPLTPLHPFLIARGVNAQISLAMPRATPLASEGLQQSWNHDPALPSSSVIPSLCLPHRHLCPPFDIFRPLSIRSFRSSWLWHGHKLSVAD